jgi:hypothetical protein
MHYEGQNCGALKGGLYVVRASCTPQILGEGQWIDALVFWDPPPVMSTLTVGGVSSLLFWDGGCTCFLGSFLAGAI